MKKLFAICVGVSLIGTAYANGPSVVQVDRYTLMQTKATVAQKDLLAVIVNVDIPGHVITVGETIQYLLTRSGFGLASAESSDPALPILLNQSLPMVHRHIGPIELRDALSTIAGPAWKLVEDPVNRLVSFQLQDKYSNFRPNDKHIN